MQPETAPLTPPASADPVREALEFVVMFSAFINRDRGTARLEPTLDGLSMMAADLDKRLRAALSRPAPAPEAERGGDAAGEANHG